MFFLRRIECEQVFFLGRTTFLSKRDPTCIKSNPFWLHRHQRHRFCLSKQQHSLNTRTAEAVNVKPDLSSHVPRLNWAHDNWALDGAEITVTWWPGICSKRSGETCCSSNWMYVWYLKITQWMNEWMNEWNNCLRR